MPNYVRNLLLLSVYLGLSSCALFGSKNISDAIELGNVKVPYLRLPLTEAPINTVFKLTVNESNREYHYIVHLEADQDSLSLVALTTFGSKVFQLTNISGTVDFQVMPYTKLWKNSRWFLMDLQLILSPFKVIQSELNDSRLQITETMLMDKVREITGDSKILIEIHYESDDFFKGLTYLKNHERHYKITTEVLSGDAP